MDERPQYASVQRGPTNTDTWGGEHCAQAAERSNRLGAPGQASSPVT